MFPLCTRNLYTPVGCGGLSIVDTSIELRFESEQAAEEVHKVCIAWFGVDGHVRCFSIRGQMRVDSSRDTGRKTCSCMHHVNF
jgi:hypothetical protein